MIEFQAPQMFPALFAVALPVLIHFLIRAKTKSFYFPAIFLFKETIRKRHQQIKFSQLLLLLVRILIVLFLALASTKPVIRIPSKWAFLSSGVTDYILILDHSLSMKAGKNNTTLFEEMSAKAIHFLEKVGERDRVTILSTDAASSILGNHFERMNSENITRIQQTLKCGYGKSDLLQTYQRAQSLLERIASREKAIAVFSDFQESSAQPLLDHLSNIKNPIPTLLFFPENTSGVSVNNFYFEDIQIPFVSYLEKETVPVEIKIAVSGGPHSPALLRVSLNGLPLKEMPLKVKEGSVITQTLLIPRNQNEDTLINAVLSGDQFKEDNSCYGLFKGPPLIRILILQSADENKAFYLERALDPFASEDGKGKTSFIVKTASSLEEISHLSNHDLIILPDAGTLSQGQTHLLEEFVRSGGGLLAGFGLSTPLESINALWHKKDGAFAVKLLRVKASEEKPRLIVTKDGERFLDALSDPLYWRSAYYSRMLEIDTKEISGSNQIWIQNEENEPFLMIRKIGSGFAAWFLTDPSPQGTSLVLEPVFVPLIHRMADFLTQGKRRKIYSRIGDRIFFDSKEGTDILTCLDPDMRKTVLHKKDADHLFFYAEKPGMYKIIKEQKTVRQFVVNTIPSESQLTYLPKQTWLPVASPPLFIGSTNEDMDLFLKQHSGFFNLWQALLWMVVVMFILEMLIISRLRK
ncbi:MAG: BatA and WFA domain-containing protein [Candidatus Aureabacteria bacterium]|nr:BatA and WFA domain-containing protein [Candidatus Auribacterota bacterium]